jgi:hypothetical protein
MIRDYSPRDFEAIKRIHEASGLPYQLPQMNISTPKGVKKAPLWLVTKVLEVDGTVRAALGSWIQVELYCWIDKSDWTDAEGKHLALQLLEKETMRELYLKGIEHATLWLPPDMERFGQRLVEDFGFQRTDGWVTYSKHTGRSQ